MAKIIIELDESFIKPVQDATREFGGEFEHVESSRFEGCDGLVQALVVLSGTTIPVVSKLILESIRARKHVLVKYKGVVVSGVSEKTVISVLEKLSRED